jgi:hypothetical protein
MLISRTCLKVWDQSWTSLSSDKRLGTVLALWKWDLLRKLRLPLTKSMAKG